MKNRVVVWFSCGAPSAVCAKLMTEKYGDDCIVAYCDVSHDEHPDNMRFLRDVERWIGSPVTILRSEKYSDIDDVFKRTRYMAGIAGARCTTELKKSVRHKFQRPDDVHVFGFTADERARAKQLENNNPELYLEHPLIDSGLTRQDCLETIYRAGIELPAMYRMGYEHNNCRGCVKATSPKYWNKIRRDFPEVFDARAKRSRDIGARLVRYNGERIFLDELPEDSQEDLFEDLSCGPQCGMV